MLMAAAVARTDSLNIWITSDSQLRTVLVIYTGNAYTHSILMHLLLNWTLGLDRKLVWQCAIVILVYCMVVCVKIHVLSLRKSWWCRCQTVYTLLKSNSTVLLIGDWKHHFCQWSKNICNILKGFVILEIYSKFLTSKFASLGCLKAWSWVPCFLLLMICFEHLTRCRNTIRFTVLRRCLVVKDLSILFDSDFSFNVHIRPVCSSVMKTLGFIYRANQNTLLIVLTR